jgi:ribosome modulation factor
MLKAIVEAATFLKQRLLATQDLHESEKCFVRKEQAMSQETLTSQEVYQAGYLAGFAGRQPHPERFPGQEAEYREGHHKGWQDGYVNQAFRG